MAKENRLYEIDLLRFVGALMVVLFHYAFRGWAADNMSKLPYPLLAPVAQYGYLGVDLFFIISGFVILMTIPQVSAKRFLISRVVRLYPGFWVCCTATFLVTLLIGYPRYSVTISQYLVNMTMMSGFVGVDPVDGAYWALFVELKFYLLVFAVLVSGMIKHAEKLLALWLAALLVLLKWHIRFIPFFLIPDYAPFFISGGMFYLIYAYGLNPLRCGVLLVSCLLAIWQAASSASRMASSYNSVFHPSIIALIISVFFLIFLLIALRKTGWFSSPRWLILGGVTYPLYLIHQYVGFMIFNVAYPSINANVLLWGTMALMLCWAYLVHNYVEQRCVLPLKRILGKMLRV